MKLEEIVLHWVATDVSKTVNGIKDLLCPLSRDHQSGFIYGNIELDVVVEVDACDGGSVGSDFD